MRRWPVPAGRITTSPGSTVSTCPLAPPNSTVARPRAMPSPSCVAGGKAGEGEEGMEAVAPAVAPAVLVEGAFERRCRIRRARKVHGGAIDHQRQVRVVGRL